MELNELEEMMTEEPGDAEAAIAELAASSNVEELAKIATSARIARLAEAAVEALGEVGGPQATAVLRDMATTANRRLVEGGTEQQIEQNRMRGRVVQSLARARGVAPPAGGSQEDIEAFIESVREI
jgi:hypothetical protein